MRTSLATKADLHQFRAEMGQEFAVIHRDIQALESGLRKDLQLLSATITLRSVHLPMIGFGVLFAALKFT
jgi:hypothetical protein